MQTNAKKLISVVEIVLPLKNVQNKDDSEGDGS